MEERWVEEESVNMWWSKELCLGKVKLDGENRMVRGWMRSCANGV